MAKLNVFAADVATTHPKVPRITHATTRCTAHVVHDYFRRRHCLTTFVARVTRDLHVTFFLWKVSGASAMICELHAGDALFLPRGWHHAVISHAPERRNLAVNTWYDLQGKSVPLERVSALGDLFQGEGCG